MIKAVISDLGGVFLNRGIWKFWYYVEKEYGISFEKVKSSFLRHYKPYFSGEISEEDFWNRFLNEIKLKEDWLELRSILLDFFEPNNGIIELYKKLRGKGIRLVLLSDQTKEWWPFLDNKYEIESYFDKTIVSALIGVNKPDPKIYQLALEASEAKPEECVFIDDLKHNLKPAERLGMKTVFYYKDTEQLKKELASFGVI